MMQNVVIPRLYRPEGSGVVGFTAQLTGTKGAIQTDYEFHQHLVASAGIPVLERLARAVISEYFRQTASLRLDLVLVGNPRTILNHGPLLAALEAHDPSGSADAMRYHFRMIRGLMEAAWPPSEGKPATS